MKLYYQRNWCQKSQQKSCWIQASGGHVVNVASLAGQAGKAIGQKDPPPIFCQKFMSIKHQHGWFYDIGLLD